MPKRCLNWYLFKVNGVKLPHLDTMLCWYTHTGHPHESDSQWCPSVCSLGHPPPLAWWRCPGRCRSVMSQWKPKHSSRGNTVFAACADEAAVNIRTHNGVQPNFCRTASVSDVVVRVPRSVRCTLENCHASADHTMPYCDMFDCYVDKLWSSACHSRGQWCTAYLDRILNRQSAHLAIVKIKPDISVDVH